MTNKPAKLVHESDTQRQHVRVHLPAKVEIGDRTHKSKEWSNGGISIVADEKDLSSYQKNIIYKAIITFDLEEFDISIPMELEVRNIDSKNNRIGFRFVEMTERQISVMQQLVSAYVTGEIVGAGDIINVVGRSNFSRERKIPSADAGLSNLQKGRRKFAKILRVFVLLSFSLSLFAYIIFGIYERLYIVSASSAFVTSESIAVKSTGTGNIFYKFNELGNEIKKGEPLFSISRADGSLISIDSPCDCVLMENLYSDNAMVRKGQAVTSLSALDSLAFVEAAVDFDQSVKLAKGQKVHLNFFGDDLYIIGTIVSIKAGAIHGSASIVKISPDEKISSALKGRPVNVTVDTLGLTN